MSEFKETQRQKDATKILTSLARHICLYGGSRSGKTFKLIRSIIIRAVKYKSDHVIIRKTFSECKKSIWLNTFPDVLNVCFPDLNVKENFNNQDYYFKMPHNNSRIWIAGLGNKQEIEKILGNEYSTMFFNECSQLSYSAVQIALTRLAQKNDLVKRIYYDQNPPSKKHWTYNIFFENKNPIDGTFLKSGDYKHFLMNPIDNLDNIDSGYLGYLESLSEEDRNRFLYGKFREVDDGLAYYAFSSSNMFDYPIKQQGTTFVGRDFNINPMSAVIYKMIEGEMYVFDEIFLKNADTFKMRDELIKKGHQGATVIPDSTGRNRKTSGKSDHLILKEGGFTVASTRNPYQRDRVNAVNNALSLERLHIHKKCKNLIKDLNQACWLEGKNDLDKKSDPLLNQIADALGYGVWYHLGLKNNEPIKMRISI